MFGCSAVNEFNDRSRRCEFKAFYDVFWFYLSEPVFRMRSQHAAVRCCRYFTRLSRLAKHWLTGKCYRLEQSKGHFVRNEWKMFGLFVCRCYHPRQLSTPLHQIVMNFSGVSETKIHIEFVVGVNGRQMYNKYLRLFPAKMRGYDFSPGIQR